MGLHGQSYRQETKRPESPDPERLAFSDHSIHFYENDALLIDNLSEFVGSALGAGGACIVIATQAHHRILNRQLRNHAIGTRQAMAEGRYIALEAGRTLSRFMDHGHPDSERFFDTIEPALAKAKSAMRRPTGPLAIFGEMVAILWGEGNREGAIELEHRWNDLAARNNFNLRCAYPMGDFAVDSHSEMFREICSQHSKVIPLESCASLQNEDDRLHVAGSAHQKASAVQVALEERERAVAQRKVVEEKLRRTEEFTRNIIESSVDCVEVLDLQGRIQYMSPSGQRALEITDASQFLNKQWTDFWKDEDRSRADDAFSAARKGGVGSLHGDSTTPSGKRKSWDVRITPALDKNGDIERLVAVSRDITELRNAQQLAIQAEKLAATGRLAATIAHEINNPLEAVTNFIYLAMTAKGLPEEVCRHLEIADRELARVAQIAQQTLGFYRDNSKDRWIAIADLIHDVVVVYERKLTYKHLETEITVDPDLRLYCRQGELRQALSNLIANAIDASREGGKIWFRAHSAKRWNRGEEPGVRITLADNGVGMSRETQKKIFVPFFTTKAEIGTGIGLWATKSLIEQQGGNMRFRSRQGRRTGTVMSLFLPNTHPAKVHA